MLVTPWRLELDLNNPDLSQTEMQRPQNILEHLGHR